MADLACTPSPTPALLNSAEVHILPSDSIPAPASPTSSGTLHLGVAGKGGCFELHNFLSDWRNTLLAQMEVGH